MSKQVYESCKNCKYGFFDSGGVQRCGIGANSLVSDACNWEPRDETSGWVTETLSEGNYRTVQLVPDIYPEDLHEALLTLPADKYLELYSLMRKYVFKAQHPEDE